MATNKLLAAYAGQRCFIVYRLEQLPDGKLDKIPTHPVTLKNCDSQDPANWMEPALALQWAQHLGAQYGVGLVIADGSGIGCIDLDKHLIQDEDKSYRWSDFALAMCARFTGAYMEVSASGCGMHIFFRYNIVVPEHRVRNNEVSMECYTRKRFIALTGTMEAGDPLLDCTAALQQVITEYFPRPLQSSVAGWTDEPVAAWSGPEDDDQLIPIALSSVRAGGVFGGRATFAQLWNHETEALARHYPGSGEDAFNRSDADLALMNHLAFFTGSNCERMQRMAYRSGLVREKWERPGYLRNTILKAAGECENWYHGMRTPTPPAQPVLGAPPADPEPPAVVYEKPGPGAFLLLDGQQQLFAGCTYIQDVHAILIPDGQTLNQERFDAAFNGYEFQMTTDGQRPVKRAWECFLHSNIYHFPKAGGLLFDPRLPSHVRVHRDGIDYINSWKPIYIPKRKGDPSPFVNHLRALYPLDNDADILLAYFAALVQYPGVKFQWCPLLQGVEGNGKTFFSFALEQCVGARYTHHAKASELDSRFNSALYGKLLVTIEDVKITENKQSVWETLKPMITNSRLEIEGKGVDKVTRDVCFNFILNSNYKDAIRKTRNDRRIAPFFGAQQHMADLDRSGLTKDYFLALYKWARSGGWEIIADFLSNYAIPDELNPAKDCVRAPETSSTRDAIVASRGSVEQELTEAIEEGREGFRGGWISSHAVDQLLRDIGKARYIPPAKRRELMEGIGYLLHPGLPDGRIALPGNRKPRIYIALGHRDLNVLGVGLITKLYQDAQGVV